MATGAAGGDRAMDVGPFALVLVALGAFGGVRIFVQWYWVLLGMHRCRRENYQNQRSRSDRIARNLQPELEYFCEQALEFPYLITSLL